MDGGPKLRLEYNEGGGLTIIPNIQHFYRDDDQEGVVLVGQSEKVAIASDGDDAGGLIAVMYGELDENGYETSFTRVSIGPVNRDELIDRLINLNIPQHDPPAEPGAPGENPPDDQDMVGGRKHKTRSRQPRKTKRRKTLRRK